MFEDGPNLLDSIAKREMGMHLRIGPAVVNGLLQYTK
jgi:hypothetical protein